MDLMWFFRIYFRTFFSIFFAYFCFYFYFYFYFCFIFFIFTYLFLFLSFQRIASLIQVIIEFDSRGCVGRMLESHHKSYFGVIPYTLVKCFCLSIYISFRMKYHILWIFVSSLLFVCLYTMSVHAGVESPALRMQP